MQSRALVIGAAHLDIVGEYPVHISSVIDKPGNIFYSVGGTAYNIAANLAHNGAAVSIMTVLKEESLVQPIIMGRLESFGISTEYVQVSQSADESGFVAHREDGKLVSAVTASTMESFTCPEPTLHKAVSEATLVICDCNITGTVLNRISRICHQLGKKLVVSAVSEHKAHRLHQITKYPGASYPIFLTAMNEEEAKVIGCFRDSFSQDDAIAICEQLGSLNVIITLSNNGYCALESTGKSFSFPAPKLDNVISVTGAGDALLAGACLSLLNLGGTDWNHARTMIDRCVSESLKQRGATIGAETRPAELRVIPIDKYEKLIVQEKDNLIKLFGEPIRLFGRSYAKGDVLAVIGLLGTAIGIVVAVLSYLNDLAR